MKWKILEFNPPPFEKKLIIGFKDGGWTSARLEKIETTASGTIYHFKEGENEYTGATHFCIPEVPKEK